MTHPPVKMFITTRDRPSCVISSLSSLNDALSSCGIGKLDCYIIDDSTQENLRKELKYQLQHLNSPYLHFIHLDNLFSKRLIAILDKSPQGKFVKENIRELGVGTWDHAGARNFSALVAFAVSASNTISVFLDDDILYSDTTYQGTKFSVPGCEILYRLISKVKPTSVSVSGNSVIGRADLSVIEHVLFTLRDITRKIQSPTSYPKLVEDILETFRFPQALPIYLINSDEISSMQTLPLGPGNISGATIATNQITINSLPYISAYNEDWIWLSLLGYGKSPINKIQGELLHAPPSPTYVDIEFAKYQEYGEILYETIEYTLRDIPEDENRVFWCLKEVNSKGFEAEIESILTEHCSRYSECFHLLNKLKIFIPAGLSVTLSNSVERADKSHLNDMYVFLTQLETYTTSIKPETVIQDIKAYLRFSTQWRQVLNQYQNVLENEIYSI